MTRQDSYLEVVWTDEVTGVRGFVVVDQLSRGVGGGGLRMRSGVTLDEVRDLARGMTLKESVVYTEGDRYVPLGGAKGGIDCDPYDPRARGILARYARAMKPLIETCFATGEDFGLRQELVDEVFAEEGIRSSAESALQLVADGADAAHERLKQGFACQVDGVGLGELVGGYGVAECTLAAMDSLRMSPKQTRAVVQGFGSMGGATARYLAAAGVRVVAIADREGLVVNDDGLDVEQLLQSRDGFGVIDRSRLGPKDRERSGHDWYRVDAEVLVPAAMSYVIEASHVPAISARIISEAANVATSLDAERELWERGTVVIPDFVANVGTNAWWWWVGFGDIEPTAAASFEKISSVLRPLTHDVLRRALEQGVPPRQAAAEISAEKRRQIAAHYPTSIQAEAVSR